MSYVTSRAAGFPGKLKAICCACDAAKASLIQCTDLLISFLGVARQLFFGFAEGIVVAVCDLGQSGEASG